MLHVNDLVYRIAGRTLFDGATVSLPAGHKAGLVGRNGTGKTTLFRLILGEAQAESGSITVRPRTRVATLAQEVPAGPEPLIDWVLAADTERAGLLAEAERAGRANDAQAIAETHNRLADIDAHGAPARAARILAGLGFDEAAQQRSLSEYSGGWRMRVALAAALFVRPDLLLLDEPTNHLDLEAAMWLEGYLRSFPGTLLIISHDRHFLNAVVDEIIHLSQHRLTRYAGGYDRFEQTRREQQEHDARLRTRQLEERRRIQAFVDRFRYKASKARQAQSRLKMLERMQPVAAAVDERTIQFDFPQPEPLSPPLIALDDVSVGYAPDSPVLTRLNQRIDMDDRIALIGANGNGKSTFVKLLARRLKPLGGRVQASSKLKVGYFAQHQIDELNPDRTAFQHLAALMPMATEAKVRAQLGRFGFEQDRAEVRAEDLSGGEKARLLFALMSREAPHVLLLDEPTNHLDVDAREVLIQALNAYEGAVVLVSHDAHLIEAVVDRLWLVEQGGCRAFDGDLDDYARLLKERRRARRREDARDDAEGDGNGPGAELSRKDQRRARAARRAETADLRRQVRDAEKRLEKQTAELGTLEAKLAHPDAYDGSTADLLKLHGRHKALKAAIAETERAWLAASEALEAAQESTPDTAGEG